MNTWTAMSKHKRVNIPLHHTYCRLKNNAQQTFLIAKTILNLSTNLIYTSHEWASIEHSYYPISPNKIYK